MSEVEEIPAERLFHIGEEQLSVEIIHYKYRLLEDYRGSLPQGWGDEEFESQYIRLTKVEGLWIKSGYCWDGPSGPTIDTIDTILASLIHDALYQILETWRKWGRPGIEILIKKYRKLADREFRRVLRAEARRISQDWPWYERIPYRLAMRLRRRAWHIGVRIGGRYHV